MIEQAAIRGWSLHELSRQSGVGRPTIYRWRDGTEVPQPRPVGLVADALGIPRERAVRLAGIVKDDVTNRPPPTLLDERLGRKDADIIRKLLRDVDPERADDILAGLEERLRRRASGHG